MSRLVKGTNTEGENFIVKYDHLKPLKIEQLKVVSIKRLLKEYRALALEIDNSQYRLTLSEQKMLQEIEKEIIQRATK